MCNRRLCDAWGQGTPWGCCITDIGLGGYCNGNIPGVARFVWRCRVQAGGQARCRITASVCVNRLTTTAWASPRLG